MFREIKAPQSTPAVTVISIIKDELFFLPAFLDHYRGLGATQFVFLDDGSTDGSIDYLSAQPDCAIIVSDLTYGQFVNGKKADVVWRTALPRTYCAGRWGLVVDVDEFLELPPSIDDISTLTRMLDAQGGTAVGAVMIDFYPANIQELGVSVPPSSKSELFARYPYFDDCPHGHWVDGHNRFHRTYGGVRDRLLLSHGVALQKSRATGLRLGALRRRLRSYFGYEKRKFFNAIHKVPLIRWSDDGYEYLSSHTVNRAPCRGLQLPLIHFKFTGSLFSKVNSAIASGAYHSQSADYRAYSDLLANMMASNSSFLCDCSRKYAGKRDFLRSGILRFDGLPVRSPAA
jgi:hypothetical protein